MGFNSRTYSLLLGALVVATLAVVPASQAAPPPGPGYQCSGFDGPDGPDPIKVMIAGDSITNASEGDYTWRYWLWKDQDGRGANVDFVGDFTDTLVVGSNQRGTHAYLDCGFDADHESRAAVKLLDPDNSVYSLAQPAPGTLDPTLPNYPSASSWINGAVQAHTPDVLVVFAGGNDLGLIGNEAGPNPSADQIATAVINRMNLVISEARAAKSNVDIAVTTIPTAGSRYAVYNQKLAQLVAADTSPNGSTLALAQLPSWSSHSWDGLHPDAVGEVGIASAIDNALHQLNPELLAAPSGRPAPAIGPRFPADTTAAPDGSNRVKLTWTLPPGADRSIVWARNTNGGPWVKKVDYVMNTLRQFYPNDGTAVCFIACTTHTVTGLSGGTTYEFKVQLGKGHAVAPESAVAPEVKTVQATGPIGAVDTPRATAGTRAVTVSWTNLTGVSLYDVQWRVGGSSAWKATTSPGSTRVISGLVAGQPYAFRVKPRNASAWSSQVVATPRAAALSPGRRPVLAKVRGVRIRTAWAASAGATRYQVQRRIARGPWRVVATTTKRVLVSGRLKKGKTYEFRIRPYDGLVGGAYSPVARRTAR